MGYTCKYDPTVFTLEDTEGADQFVYQTEEKLEGQVYMTVLAYADMVEGKLEEITGTFSMKNKG